MLRALHLDPDYGPPPKNDRVERIKNDESTLYRGSPTQIRAVILR